MTFWRNNIVRFPNWIALLVTVIVQISSQSTFCLNTKNKTSKTKQTKTNKQKRKNKTKQNTNTVSNNRAFLNFSLSFDELLLMNSFKFVPISCEKKPNGLDSWPSVNHLENPTQYPVSYKIRLDHIIFSIETKFTRY